MAVLGKNLAVIFYNGVGECFVGSSCGSHGGAIERKGDYRFRRTRSGTKSSEMGSEARRVHATVFDLHLLYDLQGMRHHGAMMSYMA